MLSFRVLPDTLLITPREAEGPSRFARHPPGHLDRSGEVFGFQSDTSLEFNAKDLSLRSKRHDTWRRV